MLRIMDICVFKMMLNEFLPTPLTIFFPCILISPLTSYIFLLSYLPLDCLSLNRHFIFPCFLYFIFFKSYINHIWNISHLIEFILFFEYSYLHYYRIITIFLVLMKSFQLRKTFIVNLQLYSEVDFLNLKILITYFNFFQI